MPNENDRLLKELADRYTEADGARLRAEASQLDRSGPAQDMSRLDRRVRQMTEGRRRMPWKSMGAALAACLVLALVVPRLLGLTGNDYSAAPADSSASSSEAALEGAPEEAEADYAVIPLSFELPDNFTVNEVEQDRERTIYHIEDAQQDDIVMVLRYATGDEAYDDLTPIPMGGGMAYGRSEEGYNLLCFEESGIYYELTCRHDINTLAEIGRSVL